MNILAIIQARTGSTRLPNKVLLKLEDKTVLEHVVERVKRSKLISEVIVATSLNISDLEIVKLCSNNNTRVFCGSEDDVLDRFYQTAKILEPENIVRITADCPMIDPYIIDKTIKKHLDKRADYTTNQLNETYPDGLDVEVFTFKALKQAWKESKISSQREHVTPYIHQNTGFKIACIDYEKNLKSKRWTLDGKKDYEFLRIVFKNVYTKKQNFIMEDVLDFLKENPEAENINRDIVRNEGYAKSLSEDSEITK